MVHGLKAVLAVLVLIGISGSDAVQLAGPSDPGKQLRELLRERIEQAGFPPQLTVGQEL